MGIDDSPPPTVLTLSPSSAPTVAAPSITPTTSSPSPSPSATPTTSAPTTKPTTATPSTKPTSSLPTRAPTQRPTTYSPTTLKPSATPTTVCQPGVVTCCFNAQMEIKQVFVGNTDRTVDVLPAGFLADTAVTKTLTFTEPSGLAVLAIKGFENNEILRGSLQLRCNASRADSRWNFETRPGDTLWRSVLAQDLRADVFPADWYSSAYTGGSRKAEVTTDAGYTLTNTCGGAPPPQLRPHQGNPSSFYWTLRRIVNQTQCGTNAPTMPQGNVIVAASDEETSVVLPITLGLFALVALLAVLLVARRRWSSPAAAAASNEWEEQLDEDSGMQFWVNRKTGEFSWTAPNPAATSAGLSLAVPEDPTGTFDRRTGEFSYGAAATPTTTTTPPPVSDMAVEINRATGEFSYAMPVVGTVASQPAAFDEPNIAFNKKTGEFSVHARD
jgi:hypothetical protein